MSQLSMRDRSGAGTGGRSFVWPVQGADRYLFLITGVLLFIAVVCGEPPELNGFSLNGNIFGRDFVLNWFAAKMALGGRVLELFDPGKFYAAQIEFFHRPLFDRALVYPPHFIPWVLGLGFFSYPVALALGTFIPLAGYVYAVAARRAQAWGVALALVLAPSTLVSILCGQNGFITGGLLAGGLRLLEKRPVLAGVLLGFLSFKPHMMILLPFALLAGRHWKAIGSTVVTSLLLAGISVALYGWEPWRDYLTVSVPLQRLMLEQITFCYNALMMPTPFMATRQLGASVAEAYAVAAAFGLFAAGAVIYVFKRPVNADVRAAVFMTAATLASPYFHNYDLTLMSASIIAFLAAVDARQMTPASRGLLLLAWLLPMFVVLLNANGFPLSPLILAGLLGVQVLYGSKKVCYLNASKVHRAMLGRDD
jgi:hypothetical protein